MDGIIVTKFGGSSITKYEDIEIIRGITQEDTRRKIIVVSAPGKRNSSDMKVTDMLIELAETKNALALDKIIERYKSISPYHNVKELSDLLKERLHQNIAQKAYVDSIKAFGEEACARIVANLLGFQFVDAKNIFSVSEDYGNAKILPQSEALIRDKLKNMQSTVVIPGFYGQTRDGLIATFSRGGSDLTGAYIAASLNALVYENFTDKDGIRVANPEIIKDAKKIDFITYDEIRDLAYSGFSIFHEEAMIPVSKKRIPVHVRNTFSYPEDGTYIVDDRLSDPDRPIVGVAYKGGLCAFDAAIAGLNSMIGVGRNMLQIFAEKGISIEFITTGIDDISVIFKEDQLKDSRDVSDIKNKLYLLMGEDASIDFQEHLGSLVVAGKGLRGKKGISADIQLTLAKADINIRFISQGPLERCIIYGIDYADNEKAVTAIYNKYLR